MNSISKNLRRSFERVILAAQTVECKDLHHKEAHQHTSDIICPALNELQRHIDLVKKYLTEEGK